MRKALYFTAAFIILVVVLFIYTSFNGNFISKKVAESTVKQYVEERFPEGNYSIGKGTFNFKDGSYGFEFDYQTDEQVWKYFINAGYGIWPKEITYTQLHWEQLDFEASEQWCMEGARYLQDVTKDLGWVETHAYDIELPKGYKELYPEWTPSINLPFNATVSFDVTYSEQTPEQLLKQVQQVQKVLNDSDLNYEKGYVYVTEEMDNRDGSKEGYAPIYYEGRYRVQFTPEQKMTLQDIE